MNVRVDIPIEYIDTGQPLMNKTTRKQKPESSASVQEYVDVQAKPIHHNKTNAHENEWLPIVIGGKLWDLNKYIRLVMQGVTKNCLHQKFHVLDEVVIISLLFRITKLYSGTSLPPSRLRISQAATARDG